MTDPADLGVEDAAAALADRAQSSRELVDSCLARIRERDGVHSDDGDAASVNACIPTVAWSASLQAQLGTVSP